MRYLCYLLIICAALAGCSHRVAQDDSDEFLPGVADSIAAMAKKADATVGVALICGDSVFYCNPGRYPMMSVFKLHIGLAVLDYLRANGATVDSVVEVSAAKQRPNTYSPLRQATGGQPVNLTIDSLMRLSVCYSDNNAADYLIDLTGCPAAVQAYLDSLGADSCNISQTEDDMHRVLSNSYLNYSTPLALARMIERVYTSEKIPEADRSYMQHLLEISTTGRDKIYAGLPQGTPFGHKSGLSDRLPDGTLMASSDVATFVLPDGRRCFLAIMVKDTPTDTDSISALFADITRLIYNSL